MLQTIVKWVHLWDFILEAQKLLKVPCNLWGVQMLILRWILKPSSGCTTRNHKSSPWLVAGRLLRWVALMETQSELCDWGMFLPAMLCNEWTWNTLKYSTTTNTFSNMKYSTTTRNFCLFYHISIRYKSDDFLLSWQSDPRTVAIEWPLPWMDFSTASSTAP